MSEIFKFNIGTNVYNVDGPDTNSEKWLVVAEEKYRPDKQKFIYDKFIKEYPSIKVRDAEQVYALASRSAKLNEWLAIANAEYATIEASPTYYRQYIDASDFESASIEVSNMSKAQAAKAKEQAIAATNYRNALAEIDMKYEKSLNTSNKYAKVLALNTTSLPLSIQLIIDNYTPATSSSPNVRAFARECLVSYKIALLSVIKQNKDVDIDKLIEINKEK